MNFLLIGKLIKPYGLKGEMKVAFYVDDIKELDAFSAFYIKDKKSKTGYSNLVIENIRLNNGAVLVLLKGCNDINQVEIFKGVELFVDEAETPKLKKNEFYIKDLIGSDVVYLGDHFGKLYNVIEIAGKFMLVIKMENQKDLVVPLNDTYVSEVSTEQKSLTVTAIDELL